MDTQGSVQVHSRCVLSFVCECTSTNLRSIIQCQASTFRLASPCTISMMLCRRLVTGNLGKFLWKCYNSEQCNASNLQRRLFGSIPQASSSSSSRPGLALAGSHPKSFNLSLDILYAFPAIPRRRYSNCHINLLFFQTDTLPAIWDHPSFHVTSTMGHHLPDRTTVPASPRRSLQR